MSNRSPFDEERFPLEPLTNRLGITFGQIGGHQLDQFPSGVAAASEALGRSTTWVHQVRRRGLTWTQADRAACRVGFHPGNIWPEWWNVDQAEEPPAAHRPAA